MIELRPYQEEILRVVRQKVLGGAKRLLVTAPTGAGKTVMLASQLARFLERDGGRSALYVVHRRQLVEQTAATLERYGIPATVLMAGHTTDFKKRIYIVSRDTWHRRKDHVDFGEVGLVIFDEAHIGVEAQMRMVQALEPEYVLGYTATPITNSGPGLGKLYQDLVVGPSYEELIAMGYLVPTYWLVAKPVDTSGLRVSKMTGDYVVSDVDRLVRGQVLADVYESWAEHAGERTVIFLPTVDTAHTVAARFGNMGVPAATIDWSTKPKEREEILRSFREGRIKILCNVDVFSEGWDEPLVDTIILASPTLSLARHLQRIGRGMRPAPGKPSVRIIDLVGAMAEHGIPEDITGWKLEPPRRPKEKPRPSYHLVKRKGKCPRCGKEMRGSVCECGFSAKYLPTLKVLEVVGGYKVAPAEEGDNRTRMFYYLAARGYAEEMGYKPGWAAYIYKHRYGEWPPQEWQKLQPIPPTPKLRRAFERATKVRRRKEEPLFVWRGKV